MSETPWSSGDRYEPFMGRWSALVATQFLEWLDADEGLRWVDVGCGTAALTSAIHGTRKPLSLLGIDPAESFIEFARARVPAASFEVASASDIPLDDDAVDVAVSGLVLNFVPDAEAAVAEFTRVTRPGGTVAAYLWDYPEMQLLQRFWQAAGELDVAVATLSETNRFDWNADRLTSLWRNLDNVEVRHISIQTPFDTFDAYWQPFLGGQGPAAWYLQSLDDEGRARLRETLAAQLGPGPFELTARAWAVRGTRATPAAHRSR